ncbi:MAG: hypothetical protein AAGC47_03850 [Bacteroidota bacterium]
MSIWPCRKTHVAFLFILLLGLVSCSAPNQTKEAALSIELNGEMLFEGANSLQANGEMLSQILEVAELTADQISGIQIGSAEITMNENSRRIIENLSLQLVSNNQEMTTLGALNPLPAGNVATLKMAEAADILPYLKDEGLTWVLDVNLTEDHFDELSVTGKFTFIVEYKNN